MKFQQFHHTFCFILYNKIFHQLDYISLNPFTFRTFHAFVQPTMPQLICSCWKNQFSSFGRTLRETPTFSLFGVEKLPTCIHRLGRIEKKIHEKARTTTWGGVPLYLRRRNRYLHFTEFTHFPKADGAQVKKFFTAIQFATRFARKCFRNPAGRRSKLIGILFGKARAEHKIRVILIFFSRGG